MSRVIRWDGRVLGKEVTNIFDRFKTLRNREKGKLVFTKGTEGALGKRMTEKDGQ
jgi:hypothetical protein